MKWQFENILEIMDNMGTYIERINESNYNKC